MTADKIRKSSFIWTDILLLAITAVFAFYVNSEIVIKGLYMDDLYMWSCYGEQSLTEFVFPIGTSTRFRPVYWLATYFQMMIVGTHIDWFVTFNIIINILTVYSYYYISRRLSQSRLVPFIISMSYLASRFAYYQIGQALGLMETMAQLFAICVLYCVYLYIKNGSRKSFVTALMLYFLLVFTHERYLSLFPLFYLVLIIRAAAQLHRNCQEHAAVGLWLAPALELIVIVAIRCYAIGKALPAGTGGTEVTDTFGVGQAIGFCIDQVKYIFGINAGPEYLNGLTWEDTPQRIRLMVLAGIALLAAAVLIYAADLLYRLIRKKSIGEDIATAVLFISFIVLCIGCSSVTIRLEMRWIYVSYSAALLYASYMLGQLGRRELAFDTPGQPDRRAAASNKSGQPGMRAAAPDALGQPGWENEASDMRKRSGSRTAAPKALHICKVMYGLALLCFTAYAVISIYTNIFYRGYFTRIYLWPNQLRMNSLAEQTVEKYGIDQITGKDVYILENSYEITDFNAQTFFKTYDPARKAEGTRVIFAGSMADVDMQAVASGNALVIKEVPEENAYLDITEEVLSGSSELPAGESQQ